MSAEAASLSRTIRAMRPTVPAKDFDTSKRFYIELGFRPARWPIGWSRCAWRPQRRYCHAGSASRNGAMSALNKQLWWFFEINRRRPISAIPAWGGEAKKDCLVRLLK
jgi:hypothetical protein